MSAPTHPAWTGPLYYKAADTSPGAQVFSIDSANSPGSLIANTNAAFKTWLQCGAIINGPSALAALGTANNGSGAIRVQVATTLNLTTNEIAYYVGNNVGAISPAAITVVDNTHFDIQGSTFTGADTSGIVYVAQFVDTAANMYAAIDAFNFGLQPQGYLPVTSAINYSLGNTPPLVFNFNPNAANLIMTLPLMNVPGSIAKGRRLLVFNANGTTAFTIHRFDATTLVALPGNGVVELELVDNTTQAGVLKIVRSLLTGEESIGNTDATLIALSTLITIHRTNTNFTAPRTWTLPAANAFSEGTFHLIVDGAGGVSATNTLSVARAGSDLINGGSASVVLDRVYDFVLLETNGNSQWTIVGGHGSLNFSDLLGSVAAGQMPALIGDTTSSAGSTATTTGALNGHTISPASWTPSDQSGAGLTFTGVSVNYTRHDNMIFAYGRVTYPATADTHNAKIGGLPVSVPAVNYASGVQPAAATGVAFAMVCSANGGTTTFSFFNAAGVAAITNAQLSGAVVLFNLSYPAA
jgi:hypothetical protein